jgi:FMN-dependent oxidoreductase (nitrilotriacetate monooxygenase family)
MVDKPFHLALFLNFRSPAEGARMWSRSEALSWTNGRFHVDVVQALERAAFDFVILEDSSLVPDVYRGTFEVDLKHGLNAPKHDPVPLISMLGYVTRHIGLIPTLSTSFYPPFLLARAVATLDHLTEGRMGWNIVTSSQNRAAQNYGMEKLLEHDLRYEQAEEYLQLVSRLWESWEPDARVLDVAGGVYVDHRKVHRVDFKGKYYSCRGPLNTLPPVQGRPVLCQAGQSSKGLEFAARWADTIIVSQKGIEAMKAGRTRVRDLVRASGRDPDRCKVMFLVEAFIADSRGEAIAKRERQRPRPEDQIEIALGLMSGVTEIDFSTFELDAPLPSPTTQGHQGMLNEFLRMAAGRTLREVALGWHFMSASFVGTPDSVAGEMAEIMQEVGGDGFLFSGFISRDYVHDLTHELVPELQRRGLVRERYSHDYFRDNLLEF